MTAQIVICASYSNQIPTRLATINVSTGTQSHIRGLLQPLVSRLEFVRWSYARSVKVGSEASLLDWRSVLRHSEQWTDSGESHVARLVQTRGHKHLLQGK